MRFFWRRDSLIKIFILIPIVYTMVGSCANTSTPPMGGPKDTIAPKLISTKPDSGALNFPLTKGAVELKFDEFVVLKEEQKNFYISPPLKKSPKNRIKGKSVITTFESKLDSATTYTLNYGRAIVDNNEGNPFPSYTLPFSTGESLDSLYISGRVLDAATLQPVKEATVALFSNLADSAIYSERASAIAKTDLYGYFVLRNIKEGPFNIYAFEDNNFNNNYDPENETIAFSDTLLLATTILKEGIPEIKYIKVDDTLAALSRPSQIDLYLFKEESETQFIRESQRLQPKMVYIKFAASNPQINSINLNDLDSASIKREFSPKRDSLVLWIMDTLVNPRDSLYLTIDYLKSDSLQELTPAIEKFSFAPLKEEQAQSEVGRELSARERERASRIAAMTQEKERDNLLKFKIEADPKLFEQSGFSLTFDAPLISVVKDSISLKERGARGDSSYVNFVIKSDTLWSRFLTIEPTGPIVKGSQYSLEILPGAFIDIYKNSNDTTLSSAKLPQDESLSTLTLNVSGVEGYYIVELTNVTRDRVFRSYTINQDCQLEFPYLQEGQYSIKVVEDLNGNGIIDSGNLKRKRQPERVRLYTLPDGKSIITIPESVELFQDFNLKTIFN